MPFDGIVLSAVQQELQAKLLQGRIDKIYQPSADTIVMHIRQPAETYKLLLSAHATNGRVHLTQASFSNPFSPPLFCMVLRKHLEGGRITAITQAGLERQLIITVEALDELGEWKTKLLIVEIMGKHSNIILVNKENQLILDGIKRYTHAVSRHREVLPGKIYVAPPDQKKLNPLVLREEDFREALLSADLSSKICQVLVKKIAGLSTVLAREMVFRAGLDPEAPVEIIGEYELIRLWQELQELAAAVKTNSFQPSVYFQQEKVLDFAAIQLKHLACAQERSFPSISAALDCFFQEKQAQENLEKSRQELQKIITKELEKKYKKRTILEETIAQAKNAEPYRIKGELITANIYRINRGDTKVLVHNFYDPNNSLMEIELDPELTPSENAQAYFKKYNKAKAGAKMAAQQLAVTNEEIYYLESVLQGLENASSLEDIREIEREMTAQGYLTNPEEKAKQRTAKKEDGKSQPLKFSSSEGFTILVGKNNRLNDWLTMKVAKDHDLWLHVKDLPGSHVIVQTDGKKVPENTLLEAATLAAYYSKGKYSSNIAVDWTYKKNVRKPSGAKPGMVIYENHQTIYVTPEEKIIEKIKRKA